MVPGENNSAGKNIDYREEMRQFVQRISARAKTRNPKFYVIPQNALPLITLDGKPDGTLAVKYMSSVDGQGIEELFYGHEKTGMRSSPKITRYMLPYIERLKTHDKKILVVDYVVSMSQAEESRNLSKEKGFTSFQGQPQLATIPPWKFDTRLCRVTDLHHVQNFLYLLNPSGFRDRAAYLRALGKTNHDLLIIDAFFWGSPLTPAEVEGLKRKRSGEKRLVVAYMSIGEAEDYRYYWEESWKHEPPAFLEEENPRWRGNYKVKYWMKEWQHIICGEPGDDGFSSTYLGKIMQAGFDGVYLDLLDAAFYFEKK